MKAVIESYPCVKLYIKRVLRDVHYDPDDLYIYRKLVSLISEMILEKSGGDTSEESIKRAIAQMEPPAKLGKKLRADYKADENGIMLFNRTIVNFAAPALLMAAAFVVFRLYPATEYVAYAVIAIVAGLAAYYAYRNFYKLRYCILAVALPAFLLIYYPTRDALKSNDDFISLLFSYSNHVVLTLIAIILIVFPSVAAVLYAREYASVKRKRIYTAALCIMLVLMVALFGLHAYELKLDYDADAASLLEKINGLYSLYNPSEPPDMELVLAVKMAEELEQKYADIYVPPNKQTSGALSELLECFSLYSKDYSFLVKHFHPQFNPSDSKRSFDIEALEKFMQMCIKDTALAVEKAAGNPSFRSLVTLESDCRNVLKDLSIYIAGAYNAWIFSSK